MREVAIIGSSISATLLACYLRTRFPELRVSFIGPREMKLPIVGESLTEFSTYMLNSIGLRSYLETEHHHKYGLSFYYKAQLSDPSDRRYVVHEAPAIPPMPGKQINRFTLDKRLFARAEELGAEHTEGRVLSFSLNESGRHTLVVKTPQADAHTLSADWIIDASGRRQLLASSLGLKCKTPFQRSSFWVRVKNFDRAAFERIQAERDPQIAFDSYFATHHFIGAQKWIWCIPMRGAGGEELMSIGLVWRPDLYAKKINRLEAFLQELDAEHPVVADAIRSGEVLDTNYYANYFYSSERLYHVGQRWALIGDAGFAVDPLYSTGLVLTCLQATQIGALLEQDMRGTLREEFAQDLESALTTFRDTIQGEISSLYEVLHDAYQASWRVHFSSTLYFFSLLPAWLCGYMADPKGARWLRQMLLLGSLDRPSMLRLLPIAAARSAEVTLKHLPNRYPVSVNWDLWGAQPKRLGRYFAGLNLRFASYRFAILRQAGWHEWPTHLAVCLRQLLVALVFRLGARGDFLSSWPVQLLLRLPVPGMNSMRKESALTAKMSEKVQAHSDVGTMSALEHGNSNVHSISKEYSTYPEQAAAVDPVRASG